jgi:Spy/CpxP family protein refolding chaperone
MGPVVRAGYGERPVVARIPWWRKTTVQQMLKLTKAQVDRLDTLFEEDRPERVALRRKIAEMDRLLRRVLERGNAEDTTVKRLSEQVEALRAQHNVRRTLMLFAMYRRLTPEQRAAFTEMRRSDADMRSGPDRDSER